MDIKKTPEISTGQMKTIGFIIITIVIIYALYVILQRLGLIRSKGEKDAAKAKDATTAAKSVIEKQVLTSQLLNPAYMNSSGVDQNMLLSEASAEDYAKKIHDDLAKIPLLNIIVSNSAAIFGIFQQLSYAPQVSQIADKYFQIYGLSLSDNFKEYLSKSDLLDLMAIIDKIPKS